MLVDFVYINRSSKIPAYRQLLDELCRAIESGTLSPGEKMPSVRLAAKELALSRTTVETAYQQLCMRGYLVSKPQSGYFVAEQGRAFQDNSIRDIPLLHEPLFDFRSHGVDSSYTDLRVWQKQIRAVLSEEQTMTSYGDPQGEYALRKALSDYTFKARGVRAKPDQIIIGAGIQPLLGLMCSLLPRKNTTIVGLGAPGFPHAEQILADYGMQVIHLGNDIKKIPENVHLYIYLPSRITFDRYGKELERRNALVAWRKEGESHYLLEDDYNGELRFLSRPLPALQGLDEGVIFLGSFSKLLLPSIRIAYMVLPNSLVQLYNKKSAYYNQTVGKVEQLALAEYIRQGFLEKHLRRIRKIYKKKSRMMEESFRRHLPCNSEYELWETELCFIVTIKGNISAEILLERVKKKGVCFDVLDDKSAGQIKMSLSFSGIHTDKIDEGIRILSEGLTELLEEQ